MELGGLVECLRLAKEKQASSEVIEIVELAIQQRQEIEK
jgi:hypothetical protein